MPLNKQQRYKKRQLEKGRCTKCPKKILKWGLCKRHIKMKLVEYETRRRMDGRTRRYKVKVETFGKLV